jgi:hypothetical protein
MSRRSTTELKKLCNLRQNGDGMQVHVQGFKNLVQLLMLDSWVRTCTESWSQCDGRRLIGPARLNAHRELHSTKKPCTATDQGAFLIGGN